MTPPSPPSYTPRQVDTLYALKKIKMAWIAFWVIIVVFLALLGLLLYCFFGEKGTTECQFIVGLIDWTVGLSLRTIIRHLFPPVK